MPPKLAMILIRFLDVLTWVIIARALLSWFVRDPDNPLMRILRTLTDPLMRPLQPYPTFGTLDLTPLILILVFQGLQRLIIATAGG